MSDYIQVAVGREHPLWANLKMKGDGMKSVLTESGFMLMLVFDPLSAAEAEAMQTRDYRFGVVKMDGGYAWLLDTPVGALDGPFAPMLNSPDQRHIPDAERFATEPLLRLAVSVTTMDGQGIVQAMRFMTVSPAFSRQLALWHEQGLRDWRGPEAWDQTIQRFYARYARPQDAMRVAITCKGGD